MAQQRVNVARHSGRRAQWLLDRAWMSRQAFTLPRVSRELQLDPCTLWLTTYGISVNPTDPLSCSAPIPWALDRRGPQATSDSFPAPECFDMHFRDEITRLRATRQALNDSPGAYISCEPMQPLLSHFQYTACVRLPCVLKWITVS